MSIQLIVDNEQRNELQCQFLLLYSAGQIFLKHEFPGEYVRNSEIPSESIYENVFPAPDSFKISAASPSTGPRQMIGFPVAIYSNSFTVIMLLLLL